MKHNYVDQINSNNIKTIQNPLSENDILFLQYKFIQHGIHNLKLENVTDARKIVDAILTSLNYYHDIAILSTKSNKKYFDIYQYLTSKYCEITQNELTEFFIDQFYFDFLIIEKNLISNDLINQFIQNILDFNFHKIMPIIIINY